MRIGCSMLNYDLCFNVHVKDNLSCRCGAPLETAFHYFFCCPQSSDIRRTMIESIELICPCNLKIVMHGIEDGDLNLNYAIFDAVHKYIIDSRRFV